MNLFEIKERLGAFRFYLTLIAVLGLCGYAGYRLGQRDIHLKEVQTKQLQQTIQNLTEENELLSRNLNILGIDLEVSRLANQNSRKQIQRELEAQVDLRKELSFYQKVMAPELEQDGFVIDALNIEASASANFYRFSLVLMQQDKRRNRVKGDLTIAIQGHLDQQPTTLNLRDLLVDKSQKLAFHFRYFEVLKGEFQVPEGFQPEVIQVKSKVEGASWGNATMERSYSWVLPQVKQASTDS